MPGLCSGEMVWLSREGSRMVPAPQQDRESFQEEMLGCGWCWAEPHSLPAYQLPLLCQNTPKNDGKQNSALFYIFLVLHEEGHVDPEWQCQLCHCRVKSLFYFSSGAETFFLKLQLKIFCTVFLSSVSHSSQVSVTGALGWKWCGSALGVLALRCSAVPYHQLWALRGAEPAAELFRISPCMNSISTISQRPSFHPCLSGGAATLSPSVIFYN